MQFVIIFAAAFTFSSLLSSSPHVVSSKSIAAPSNGTTNSTNSTALGTDEKINKSSDAKIKSNPGPKSAETNEKTPAKATSESTPVKTAPAAGTSEKMAPESGEHNEKNGEGDDAEPKEENEGAEKERQETSAKKEEEHSEKVQYNGFDVEDSHFIYFLGFFGVLVAVIYIAIHNKKKILGLIFEGRRPQSGARRSSVRYRRLSQRDDAETPLSRENEGGVIY